MFQINKGWEKTIQFLGRLVRLHKSKSKAYLDDIQYPGHYLGKHSKARVRAYKKQGYKVIMVTKATNMWKYELP